jgi:hypothetical protein
MQIDYSHGLPHIDTERTDDEYEAGEGGQAEFSLEPYKTELLAIWRFRTPEVARESAEAIYARFLQYRDANDVIGMDMARKFLQMGWTRSRRYAYHRNGRKWARVHREMLPLDPDPEKAECARIFYEFYLAARSDPFYKEAMDRRRQARPARQTIVEVVTAIETEAVIRTEKRMPRG